MATSVGGAIAEGLESGLRIGTGLVDRQRNIKRQDEADQMAREDRALGLEDRQRRIARETRADGLSAIDAQMATLKAEGAALGEGATPAQKAQLAQRFDTLSSARQRALVAAGGYDFEAEDREARSDIEVLKAGQGASLPPARRVRAITAATGRDISDFRRVGGAPSRIGQAIQDFSGGLTEADNDRMLAGANVLFASDLAKGVGTDSPYGGKIVGKQFVAFDPDPNSPPDAPRVIPRLKVYVNDGKARSPADVKKIEQLRAADPNAPAEATGYYFAPVTEDRSSSPDARVKSIGMREGMEYIDKLQQLDELINDPSVAADIDAGVGQFDQQRYLRARAGLGLPTGREKKTEFKSIPQGGSLLPVTTDDTGKVTTGQPIMGRDKQFSNRESVYQIAERLARDNGTTIDEEMANLRPDQAALAELRNRTDPNRPHGGGAGGAGGGNKVRSTRVGDNGNILLVMSDGTVKDTGQKDASFNRSVANLIAKLGKDDYKFQKLPAAEQRARALDMLGGGAAAPATPAAPAGGVPKPKTQAEYDALPKGSKYMRDDGRTYTKQ